MARIAGINIPDRQHTEIGLTAIFGIGRTRARQICEAARAGHRHQQVRQDEQRHPRRGAHGDGLPGHAALDEPANEQRRCERAHAERHVEQAHRAAAALAAEATDEWRVQCEAMEALGRAERGRDVVAAGVAFQRAHDIAAAHGLGVWRVRALQELGTIDMYQTLAVGVLIIVAFLVLSWATYKEMDEEKHKRNQMEEYAAVGGDDDEGSDDGMEELPDPYDARWAQSAKERADSE